MTRASHSLSLIRRHNAAVRAGDVADAVESRLLIDYKDLKNGFRRREPEEAMRQGQVYGYQRRRRA